MKRGLRIGRHLLFALAALASAQDFSQRGFLDTSATLYPQTAPNDSGYLWGASLLQYEAFYKLGSHFRFAGGIDAQVDTHQETERDLGLSWWDRDRQRPAFEVRRLSATYARGKLTIEAGKQFIRWGKTDILTPTDRFAPRDYFNVVDNDFLAVTAARLIYGGQVNSIDVVFEPRLTPSRVPLLNERWSGLPAGISLTELAPDFPGGPQAGARWNHIGQSLEYALSFYNGHDHLPLYRADLPFVQRFYPQMRMYGGDAALPLSLLTLKAEAAYFTSATPQADEYVLYVLQAERQSGEWSFVAGYTGEAVTRYGTTPFFSPERGFARAFTGHAGYTIDTNRSVAFEGVVRQNGQGVLLKATYSQAWGQHWRATVGVVWIHGPNGDFLGQYHYNSHGILGLRYSF